MKNIALKTVICLLLCLPIVFAVFYAVIIKESGVDAPVTGKGAYVSVKYEDAVQLEKYDAENVAFYSEVVANATLIGDAKNDIENATCYSIIVNDGKDEKTYTFYMSSKPQLCVFSDQAGKFYGIVPSDAEKLLVRTEFAHVYTKETLPTVTYSCAFEEGNLNDRAVQLTSNKYDWSVELINGDFKQCLYDNSAEPDTLIKLSKGGKYNFEFSEMPDSVELKIMHDEKVIFSGGTDGFNEDMIKRADDTLYTLEITATYLPREDRHFSGDATFVTNALYDVPTEYIPQDRGIGIGEFTIFEVTNANPGESFTVNANSMFVPADVKMQMNGNKVFMLLPADLSCDATADNELTFVSSDWGLTSVEFPIKQKNFNQMTLNGTAVANYYVESAKKQFLEAVNGATSASVSEKLWNNDDFKAPCRGDFSNFGCVLKLNDEESIRNIGIDIYVPAGTPVNATQNGKVVYAGELSLSGNTVIIDHGFEVFSYYMHLDSISCAVGDSVTQSSVLGTVGTTGFVIEDTPYLLFAVSIGSTYTNPDSVFRYGIKIPE